MSKKYTPKVKEQDGGYYFSDYDIHVVAKSLEEAKAKVLEGHGVNVDQDPNESLE